MNSGSCLETLGEIHVCDNVITEVSDKILLITGFKKSDILFQNMETVEELLRINFLSKTFKGGELLDDFLFTKELMPRHVRIGMYLTSNKRTKVYYFQSLSDFIFEDKFPVAEIMIDNGCFWVAVYHVPDMKILRASTKYAKNAFFTASETASIIGRHTYDLDKNWTQTEIYQLVQNVVNSKKQLYEDNVRKYTQDGESKFFSITMIPVCEDDNVKYIIAIHEDTKENEKIRKTAELAVKANHKNKENTDKLLKFIDLPTIRISYPELKVLSFNFKNAHNNFQHPDEEPLLRNEQGRIVSEFIVHALLTGENYKYFDEMKQKKEVVEVEGIELSLGGERHVFSFIYQPRLDNENNLYEFILIIIDENARLRNQMKFEDVMRNQSEIFSYIAHELKAPLTVIHSAIQLIDFFCHDELSERADRFINKIRQSSLQQLRLVNNFLDLNKIDSGYLKLNKKNYDIVFMTKAIVNSVSLICENKGLKLEFSSSIEAKPVYVDDEKYERILLNLLSNAIKFTPPGKRIIVDLYLENHFVNIKVKDEGVGIPEGKMDLIFEKFGQVGNGLTRNGEGTGIGLCLAKRMAKAHNGDILLKSEVGKGSEFTVLIPDIVSNEVAEEKLELINNEDRLIQSVNVEFSSIYL